MPLLRRAGKGRRPVTINSIADIWRPGTPKRVTLLDNDFFGQEEAQWEQRLQEIEEGEFEVCFSQGINIRLITDKAAEALSRVNYRNSRFTKRRLYTAWDNMRDERIFFRGFNKLVDAGIEPSHIMVYMLTGYRDGETLEEVFNRYNKMKDAGCMPYPMVYDDGNRTLKAFQRWVVRRYDDYVPWEDYAQRKQVDADLRQTTGLGKETRRADQIRLPP